MDVDDDDRPPWHEKGKLVCSHCSAAHAKQYLLLEQEGDWQGSLQVTCYGCLVVHCERSGTSSITQEEYKRKANQMWNSRKRRAQQHSGMMRGLAWQQAVSKIGKRRLGQDKEAWR